MDYSKFSEINKIFLDLYHVNKCMCSFCRCDYWCIRGYSPVYSADMCGANCRHFSGVYSAKTPLPSLHTPQCCYGKT